MMDGDSGGGMDRNWLQRVCWHAVCLAEPDADSEAWDAVSAVSDDKTSETIVLRATRRLEPGEEILLDYGPRSNAELLTTHGFALSDNPHDSVPIALAPRDENAPTKAKLLAAGNLSSPYALSPSALKSDSDLLVALRIIAATPVELKRYADAFQGRPLSDRNERKWRLLLRETVEALLAEAEAETTADDDQRMLERYPWANSTTSAASRLLMAKGSAGALGGSEMLRAARRRRAAILCRLGEKRLLRQVLDDLRAALQ